MAIEFNIDISKLTTLMDEADGKPNGQIDKKVWDNFSPIFKTKQIKNYKTVEDANDIISRYFDKITKSNNPQSIAAAQFVYNKLTEMAMVLPLAPKFDEIKDLHGKIKNQLKAAQ